MNLFLLLTAFILGIFTGALIYSIKLNQLWLRKKRIAFSKEVLNRVAKNMFGKRKNEWTSHPNHRFKVGDQELSMSDSSAKLFQATEDKMQFQAYERDRLKYEREKLHDRYNYAITMMRNMKLTDYKHEETEELLQEYKKYSQTCIKLNTVQLNYHQYMFSKYHSPWVWLKYPPLRFIHYTVYDEKFAKYHKSGIDITQQLEEEFNQKYGI